MNPKITLCIILLCAFIHAEAVNAQIAEFQREDGYKNKSGTHLNYQKLSSLAFAENATNSDNDTLMANGKVYFKKDLEMKTPALAFLLAIIPGVLIHGTGHLYAEKPVDALVIFGISAASVLGMILSYGTMYDKGESGAKYIYPSFVFIFLGTWAYDLIMSPIICVKENKRIREDLLSIHPYLNRNRFGKQLGLTFSYHF